MSAGVHGIDFVASLSQLTLHGLEVAMAAAITVEEHNGTPLAFDGVEEVVTVKMDGVGITFVVGAAGEDIDHESEEECGFHRYVNKCFADD